jgi:hypothetical protein
LVHSAPGKSGERKKNQKYDETNKSGLYIKEISTGLTIFMMLVCINYSMYESKGCPCHGFRSRFRFLVYRIQRTMSGHSWTTVPWIKPRSIHEFIS